MTFSEFEKMVLLKRAGGVYRMGENLDGRCNTSCIDCGSSIYKSEKKDKNGHQLKWCECDNKKYH